MPASVQQRLACSLHLLGPGHTVSQSEVGAGSEVKKTFLDP